MKVEQGQSAFVTGGGSGIGRALAVALAGRGVRVTILDLQTSHGEETVRLVEVEHARISYKPNSPSAIFIRCDVTNCDELAAAYARHQDIVGQLHICINNAGIFCANLFYEDDAWRKMLDVNLTAVINGTGKAIQAMKEQGGLILNMASVCSFVPSQVSPVYSASKAGVAMFTRSLAQLGMQGIRVNALCPEPVETRIQDSIPTWLVDFYRENMGFVSMEKVVAAAFSLLDDDSKAGECVWIPTNRPTQVWPDEETIRKYQMLMKDGSGSSVSCLPCYRALD